MKGKEAMEKINRAEEPETLFIPAGLLLGIGLGFYYGNIPAGLFIGLGAGFSIFAILKVLKKMFV